MKQHVSFFNQHIFCGGGNRKNFGPLMACEVCRCNMTPALQATINHKEQQPQARDVLASAFNGV